MTERTIFLEALEKDDPSERSAFLDAACGDNTVLRQRVEALLTSHDQAGNFPGKSAPDRIAEELKRQRTGDETQGVVRTDGKEAEEDLGFLTPSDKPDVVGRLGHYDILEVIGKGGMGTVLRAFDDQLHRVVAIKVVAAQLATNAAARKRFTREAQAQAAVSHDHVVTIHAVDGDNPRPYLVMQYVAGFSLQQRLDRDGPLTLHEILRIGMQTASGLAAAHAQGLVHRDIKPANILLENGVERVKITDFGLARAANEASLTQSGVVAGTPHYMSPEQAEGKRLDQRTDLFSLGSVLYAMCTGRAPFRADGTMAVLKRVCEETPTPIRETNPDIPDWLVAIIDKLHAKDPAERYQSAAEVAELLGQHLAHVQHPSVAPLPAAPPFVQGREVGREGKRPRERGRRWAVAAAVLLLVLGGVSLTEATGVTHLRATVIRIFTPDGTLVVETDDPAVKVTIEGDGDLVISGAGPQEVRLKAGSYKLRATKDGKAVKLDRDLVMITRGDREVVRVRLENEVPAKADNRAFVLLSGDGVAERKFETFDKAAAAAENGDVLEIRGDGPFETDGIEVHGRALAIRAAPGCRPVLSLSAKGRAHDRPIVRSDGAALAVEGLTFQRIGSSPNATALIIVYSSPLRIANCRLATKDNNTVGVWADRSPAVDVRDCVFLGPRASILWVNPKEGRLSVDNCVLASGYGVNVIHLQQTHMADVRLTRNTFVDSLALALDIFLVPDFFTSGSRPKATRYSVEAADNVFAVTDCAFCAVQNAEAWRDKSVAAGPFKTLVTDLVGWRDQRNLYPSDAAFMAMLRPGAPFEPLVGADKVAEWRQFAGPEAGTLRGKAEFAGGDLVGQSAATPERLVPKDFRLLPQSPGYQAGKDGKDLGANVDLVGPGEAYEKWKKTPAYQEWLKDTGQRVRSMSEKIDQMAPLLKRLDSGKWVRVFTREEDVKGVPNSTFAKGTVRLTHDQCLPIPTSARSNLAIRAKVKVTEAYAAILLRKNEKMYYGAWLQKNSIGISLIPARRDMQKADVQAPKDFVEFMFVVQGRKLVAILDRHYVVEAEDETLAKGSAALQAGPGGAEFKDVEIQVLDKTP